MFKFPSAMNHSQRTELLRLLARESYVERQVTLASGRASNYYIDCKRALYLPRGAFLAGELILQLLLDEPFGLNQGQRIEQVGGMAAGALALIDAALAAAHRHGVELRGFFVRRELKDHGLQQLIEGAFRPALRTAVIDDTATTGGSSLQAAEAACEAGAAVVAAFALVDRGEGAAEAFAKAGLVYKYVVAATEVRAAREAR
jgi:orotate phosphoribosyltransferase